MPDDILDKPTSMRLMRVSVFLPEITQQIHSLRASGVISSHSARTSGLEIMAALKSDGSVCTVPSGMLFAML